MSKIPFYRIPDNLFIACDYCRKRVAIYYVKQDGTHLCSVCVNKYLSEHNIKAYQVKLC